MGCILNLHDSFAGGATTGGQWELLGFSLNESGPYQTGGNWPWSTNPNYNPSVDFSNIIQGFYKFNYFSPGACGGLQEIIIPVVGGGDAGTTTSISICTTDLPINIASELGATFDGGVLQPGFMFEGNGIASAGYIEGSTDTPMDDQFDPSLVVPGSYIFILDIMPMAPAGYSLPPCCNPTTAILIVDVTESELVIGIDDNCQINLITEKGCEGATFSLWKSVGGGPYVDTGITELPYQTSENADWKWIGTGCNCGTVESNIINSDGCCINGSLTMYFDPGFCAFFLIGGLGCTGGTFKWYRQCATDDPWVHQPQHDNALFIFTNDDCCYQVVRECTNGCIYRSNIDCASGCARWL